jgi:hypothetical protein
VEDGGLMSYGVNQKDLDRALLLMWIRFSKAPSLPIYCGAAKEVRVHHQSDGAQADQFDDSAQHAGESG